jgi:hypothetical protein
MLVEFDLGSYLLLCCLRKWDIDEPRRPSPEDYARCDLLEVEAACKVAEWLGLVVADKQTVLGWKPTQLFVAQMFKRPRRCYQIARIAEAWEGDALDMIFEAAFGERYDVLAEYRQDAGFFLAYLGLMKIYNRRDLIPNSRLLNLAADSRSREKKARQK